MTDVQPVAPADDTPPGPPRMSKTARTVVEWAAIVLVALLAAFLVKTFLFQPFYIPSPSMEDTLQIDDRVLVNKLSGYGRGDIVVFKRPPGSVGSQIKDLIKRVVAMPGDTVEGRENGVYVNGEKIEERYVKKGTTTGTFGPITLDGDHVFVMGDNRSQSHDSRMFGPIDEDLVEGPAFFRFWPLSSVSTL